MTGLFCVWGIVVLVWFGFFLINLFLDSTDLEWMLVSVDLEVMDLHEDMGKPAIQYEWILSQA